MRLFLFLAFSLALLAQVDTGSISGTVRDAGGQLVPAAKVKFRNAAMGLTLEAATNTEGIYVSPPLRPGEYIVEVEAGGFERAARSLQLAVSERVSLDFQLKVGSVNTTVDVVATAAVLQTEWVLRSR